MTPNVLLAILIFLIGQFGTSVWWASKITAELSFMREMITERTKDGYTKSDAAKDLANRDQAVSSLDKRVTRLEDRFQKLPNH